MIISFAWTTPALLAGRKSVTRRNWKPSHAAKFRKGMVSDAWDKSPRFHGKDVATIRLLETPYLESTLLMPDSDYEAEGFKFLEENPELVSKKLGPINRDFFEKWRKADELLYVVRLELVEVF